MPFAIPRPRPVATPATRPIVGETDRATLHATTAVTLTIAPVERSKTPAMIQIVSPIASRPSAAHWSRIFAKLFCVKKVFVEKVSPMNSARNATTIP